MPLSVDIFNKKILSDQSRFGKYNILLSGEGGSSEFSVRPTVNGTGVLLSGEAAALPETIVYTTGDQTISGNKMFANDITVQGAVLVNQVIDITTTGTISGITGEFKYLKTEGGMFSGDNFEFYADDYVFSGVNLFILDGTGYFTNRPIVNGTGVLLSGEAYPLSNPSGFITGIDLSNYYTKDNPSGFITGLDLSSYATVTNLASTGQTLNQKINSLSGVTVLTYGDQYVDGQKIFRDQVRIKDLYVTGTQTVVNTINTNVGSNYLLLNATGGAIDAGIFIVTGDGLTGISDTGAIIGYDVPANRWVFGNASRSDDLSQLEPIAGITNITNYSGFASANYATILNLENTGSNLQNQIDNINNSGFITGVDLSNYYTNDNPSGFITGENNAFKANYLVLNSGNDPIYQRELHSNLFGRKGNIQLKNTVLPNLTSGDFVFHTIYPDSERLNIGKAILLAKPYLTVKNTNNSQDSYYPESGGGPDTISSTNFVNLNPEGPHSGLALQHVRFHPIIQNAYKKYYLRFGQAITIPMSNRYLESFIEIVWPSGEYWSVTNSGTQQYFYNVSINSPKAASFTQSHIVNFKIVFEQDDRVGTVTNYDSRVINFNYGGNSFSISGSNYEFTQKERVILTTNVGMQRW